MSVSSVRVDQLCEFLSSRIAKLESYAEKSPLEIGHSHLKIDEETESVSVIQAVEPSQEQCSICETVVKTNYVYLFARKGDYSYDRLDKKLMLYRDRMISLTSMDVHRILSHKDFGSGEQHIDPSLLYDCIKIVLSPAAALFAELKRKKSNPD